MTAPHNDGAAAPGAVTPGSDEAPAVDAARGFRDRTADSRDCRVGDAAGQALRTIEGERKASEFLARLHAEQADPDELALIVGMLYGATLRGFCRVIGKALRVCHA